MKKKLLAFLMLFTMVSSAFALSTKTQLEIVKQESDKQTLDNNQGYLLEKIIDSNSETGEFTVELKLDSTKINITEETKQKYENTEIYIMIPETNTTEERKKYLNYVESLSSKILNQNDKVKIGVIGIKGTINDAHVDEETGKRIEGANHEGSVNGTEDNAEIIIVPSNDIDAIKTSIQSINPDGNEYYLNLQAAIRLASKSYSENVNKILISLYDGVPAIAIGTHVTVTYGGLTGEYSNIEAAAKAQHEKITSKTKEEIIRLKNENIEFILLRPDDTSYDRQYYNLKTGEKILNFDGSSYVQTLYGTMDNPVYGTMYTYSEENLDKVVNEYIYNSVISLLDLPMKNIKLETYFTEDIINNFDYSFVTSSVGKVSEIDGNNKITWEIDKLDSNKNATMQYKLKAKNMADENIVNKIFLITERVSSLYDIDKSYTATLISSPQVKLSLIEEKIESKDDSNIQNPKTGDNMTIFFIAGLLLVGGIVITLKKVKTIK